MAWIKLSLISICLNQDLALACNTYRWATILHSVEQAYLKQPPSQRLSRVFKFIVALIVAMAIVASTLWLLQFPYMLEICIMTQYSALSTTTVIVYAAIYRKLQKINRLYQ
jgi:hypothetical protein